MVNVYGPVKRRVNVYTKQFVWSNSFNVMWRNTKRRQAHWHHCYMTLCVADITITYCHVFIRSLVDCVQLLQLITSTTTIRKNFVLSSTTSTAHQVQ